MLPGAQGGGAQTPRAASGEDRPTRRRPGQSQKPGLGARRPLRPQTLGGESTVTTARAQQHRRQGARTSSPGAPWAAKLDRALGARSPRLAAPARRRLDADAGPTRRPGAAAGPRDKLETVFPHSCTLMRVCTCPWAKRTDTHTHTHVHPHTHWPVSLGAAWGPGLSRSAQWTLPGVPTEKIGPLCLPPGQLCSCGGDSEQLQPGLQRH